jgi:hypothetical protein
MTPFTLEGKSYDYGTIMIPVQNQHLNADTLHNVLVKIAKDNHITITAVGTGLTEGIDLGSNDFNALKKPKVAMLVGSGVTSYDAGEIWHLFDQRYKMRITKIDASALSRVDLSKYTAFIVPNSWGGAAINQSAEKNLMEFVREGGTLIGYKNAVSWLKSKKFANIEFKKAENPLVAKNITFENRQKFNGAQVTGGAIFEAKIDRSHPINFGYKNNTISMFRNSNIYIEPDKQSYNNPIQYTSNPLLSGYISEENLALAKNAVPFQVKRLGRGRVVMFTDNTNFRAFWYGTNKLLMNAIFFANMM